MLLHDDQVGQEASACLYGKDSAPPRSDLDAPQSVCPKALLGSIAQSHKCRASSAVFRCLQGPPDALDVETLLFVRLHS